MKKKLDLEVGQEIILPQFIGCVTSENFIDQVRTANGDNLGSIPYTTVAKVQQILNDILKVQPVNLKYPIFVNKSDIKVGKKPEIEKVKNKYA